MDLATFLVQCLNAVQYGLLLFLVASGLTLIFGIMGVINLAHGSFYMLGAYLAFSLAPYFGQLVRLEVAGGGFEVRPAEAAEAEAFWESRRPEGPPLSPRLDTPASPPQQEEQAAH